MYNQKEKEGFIEDYMRSRVVAKTSLYSLFRKTKSHEEKYGKDCSQFTKNEIIEMYKEFGARSHHVLLNYNVVLKAYCAWRKHYCGVPTFGEYDNITADVARSLVPEDAKRVLSREEVTEIEDQLYNWTDKAIVEALFEGLSGNSMRDLVGVELRMINHDTKQLELPDSRVFDLTDKLYVFLVIACKEEEYICYGETMRVKKMVGHNKLYKERDNAYATESDDKLFRWIYRKVQNFRKHVGIDNITMKSYKLQA